VGLVIDFEPEFDPERAKSLQIANDLRQAIVSGKLSPGERVPAELQLIQQYTVSRTTVRRALADLRTEGLVEVRTPKGTYVVDREPTATVALRSGDSAIARMPTPVERHAHELLKEGEPVIEIHRKDGQVEIHGAYRARLVVK
jgi:DNA-binding GntR family transcriptional regulator